MEIGTGLPTQYPAGESPRAAAASIRRIASVVEESGFDSVWVGEHHVTSEFHYFHNVPVLGMLASATESVDIGAGAILLPLHNPVNVAEMGATIDVLSGGRFRAAFGLGYREAEYDAFGVDIADRVGRLEEGIEVVKRLWTDGETSFDGEHYQLSGVETNPRPLQEPAPPVYVAGFVDAACERAGRLGDSWLAGPLVERTELARQMDVYERAVADHDRRDACLPPTVVREGFVLPDGEAAFETVRPYLQDKYESYSAWGLEDADFEEGFREVAADRFLIGSPSDVLEELEAYADLGIENVVFRVHYPGMDVDDVVRCLHTLGDDVLPDV
jgi:probable F420-dependent oxidoreductase